MTNARDNWQPVARRLWVWPVAILVSFPIGGFLADLVVNGVDSVGAALAGGLIAGAIIGAAEWLRTTAATARGTPLPPGETSISGAGPSRRVANRSGAGTVWLGVASPDFGVARVGS